MKWRRFRESVSEIVIIAKLLVWIGFNRDAIRRAKI